MKRSEVIEDIANLIFPYLPQDALASEQSVFVAKEILYKIEALGMKPPNDPNLLSNDWGMVANTFRWESENG